MTEMWGKRQQSVRKRPGNGFLASPTRTRKRGGNLHETARTRRPPVGVGHPPLYNRGVAATDPLREGTHLEDQVLAASRECAICGAPPPLTKGLCARCYTRMWHRRKRGSVVTGDAPDTREGPHASWNCFDCGVLPPAEEASDCEQCWAIVHARREFGL